MKKLFYVLIAVVMFGMTMSVNAITKENLMSKLKQTYDINGRSFTLSNSQILEIERYIDQNKLTESQMDVVSSTVDQIVSILRKGNATHFSELTSNERSQIIKLLRKMYDETQIDISVNGDNVVVKNTDGSVYTKKTVSGSMIQYTDDSNAWMLFLGMISFVGISLVVYKVKKANV